MPDLAAQRILLTGASGFLGTHTACQLLASGLPPAQLLTPTRADADLRDPAAVRALLASSFGGQGPTLILHAAGFVGGLGANRQWPATFFHDNLAMALHLVEQARALGLIDKGLRFVQVGTMCSYPAQAGVPYREDSLWGGAPDPEIASYGLAKLAILQMLEAYRLQHGLRSAYVIPTGFFGPGDNMNPANSHVAGALVKKYVDAADAGEARVVNWGSGSPRRDFLFIRDAARGLIRAAEVMDTPTPINLTGGVEVSIRELAEVVARLAGFRGETVWDTTKGDGQARRSLDGSRARALLNWAPETSLEAGLAETIAWYRARKAATASGH